MTINAFVKKLLAELWNGLPYSDSPEAGLMKLRDPALRRRLAEWIRKAKGIEEEAVGMLEKALKKF